MKHPNVQTSKPANNRRAGSPNGSGDAALLLLTCFGLGRSRFAPGTLGSIPPVVIALALVWLLVPGWMIEICLILLGLAFAIACVRFGGDAEAQFGRKDPSQVVADEVAGQCIPLLLLPWRHPDAADALAWNASLAFIAFITFRIFDITKPPPAEQSQRFVGGWGILVDDLIAGIYALIATQLAARLLLPLVLA